MEECPYCGSRSVREYDDRCPACNEHVGYPNVRRASRQDEQSALDARLRVAREEARRRGIEAVFEDFLTAVSSGQAVMCRSLSDTIRLIESDNQMYVSFYGQVAGGTRRPETTQTEVDRTVADQRLFPHYAKEICFAALSLDGSGPAHYGDCSLTLKTRTIERRASVFEANSLYEVRNRDYGEVPAGHRAAWERKHDLAAAKLENRIMAETAPQDFPRILQGVPPGSTEEDFVEVHIFGPIHRDALERIVVRRSGPMKAEKTLIKKLRKAAAALPGVAFEERS